VVVTGATGTGKSLLCQQIAKFRSNGLVVDSIGDFQLGTPIRNWGDVPNVVRGGWWSVQVGLYNDSPALVRCTVALVKRYGLHDVNEKNKRKHLLPRPFTLVVEEADMYGGPSWNMRELTEVSNWGRHYGCKTIINVHAISRAPKEWFYNADVVLFGHGGENDDVHVKKHLGAKLFSLYKENLKEFHFVAKTKWNSGGVVGYIKSENRLVVVPA